MTRWTFEEVRDLYARAEKAERERDEAREWVRKLTSDERILTCVYCGHSYPPGTPAHGSDVLTAHIETCHQHPISMIKAERDRFRAWLDDALVRSAREADEYSAVNAKLSMALERAAKALRNISAILPCAKPCPLENERQVCSLGFGHGRGKCAGCMARAGLDKHKEASDIPIWNEDD